MIDLANRHTFIVLAYKNSPFLEDCIKSLKNQTLPSQIYIATSTPSEFLDQIANSYNIKVLINHNSNGIASDWSFAYAVCNTGYLTLAHQDDIYLPTYTETCLQQIKKHSHEKELIIFTRYAEIIQSTVRHNALHLFIKDILKLPFFIKRSIKSNLIKKSLLLFGNPISCPTVMYHKNAIGKFEFSDSFICNLDWDAWLRLSSLKGSFIYANKTLVYHRLTNNSQTTKQINLNTRYKEDMAIFKRLWPKPIAYMLGKGYSLATRFNKLG